MSEVGQEVSLSASSTVSLGESRDGVLRLYRGLKTAYRPEKVLSTSDPYPAGTDFTDCPYTALRYASTPRGVVIVLEVPPTATGKVSEELWPNDEARRLMVWGRFDAFIARVIPAKELRAQLRKRGIAGLDHRSKAIVLADYVDEVLRENGMQAATSGRGPVRSQRVRKSGTRCRRPLSTNTVTPAGNIVPWLAAEGPLSYSPEEPPDRDYFFQYGWVLPGIFAEHTNRRRHRYFGACFKDQCEGLFSFWRDARKGTPRRIVCCPGSIGPEAVTAPLAIYGPLPGWHGPEFLLLQHGSYQLVPVENQPLLADGELVLYRGLQEATTFRLFVPGNLDAARDRAWQRYLGVQAHVLSDAARSFNSIHDRASRCETEHLRDRSWMTDAIATRHGLDIESPGFARELWQSAHQSFSLARWVAERKFGPHYVVCKTPLSNIRLTTFFAGEHEVRIIDPGQVVVLEEHGCRAEVSTAG